MELRHHALHAFEICDPLAKADAVQAIAGALTSMPLAVGALLPWPQAPGRPMHPDLVQPKEVPRRSPFTLEGHAALVHSIAHIEFNAINLALDAVWRFPGMPERYYRDWMQVALEESQHFSMLEAHLRHCGYRYGHFPAHDGLWTMCENTRHDVVARMALVPRTLEARGLDATPVIQTKLRKVGTPQALEVCDILDTILREEVGHVSVGNHWFHWLCARDGLDASAFYAQAAIRHAAPRPKPPFNLEARRRAGFSEDELLRLQTMVSPELAPV